MHYVVVWHGLTALFAGLGGFREKLLFIALCLPFELLTGFFLLKNRNGMVFWAIVGCILVQLLFQDGDDISHHSFRIIGLAEELHRRNFSGLLINPRTGQAFPVFVFFSLMPYLPAICLHAIGFPAYIAMKLSLAGFLVFFAAGLYRLVKIGSERSGAGAGADFNFRLLALSLFISSNFVFGLWTMQDELGEIAIYAFVPWIVLAVISETSVFILMALFFVQVSIQPVLFGQALIGEVALTYGASQLDLSGIARRFAPPILAALVVAMPFWLPQILWLGLIVGNAALPIRFYDTFVSPLTVFSPIWEHAIGPFLVLAVVFMAVMARERLNTRAWLLAAALALVLAIETTALRGIVMRIPGMGIFQFVFRFMMPAAFIALGLLLAILSPAKPGARTVLATLVGLTSLTIFVARVVQVPRDIDPYVYDSQGYEDYLVAANPFGVALLLPRYARLPANCDAAVSGGSTMASFESLLHGVAPGTAYLSVANAPIGIVGYEAGGIALGQARCGSDLILGPVPAGATVVVKDGVLRAVSCLRAASLLFALLVFLGLPALYRRRAGARRAAGTAA